METGALRAPLPGLQVAPGDQQEASERDESVPSPAAENAGGEVRQACEKHNGPTLTHAVLLLCLPAR